MELSDFSRVLTHLRKEKGISQRQAAKDLKISQSLLSHYEKGIRECGLLFLVRAADYYGVTVDYILGRSYDKNGNTISMEEIPDSDGAKGNTGIKSMLPVLNKKLICNSVSVIMDILSQANNRKLTIEASNYLSLSVYKIFRMLYNANPSNDQTMFGAGEKSFAYMTDAAMSMSLTRITNILNEQEAKMISALLINEDIINQKYPDMSSSLLNLLQNSENKIGARKA